MPFLAQRLIADRLTCVRGERTLFADLSFFIENHAGLTLTGPNGVGKTSLLRILAGLLQPSRGEVRIEPDHDIPAAEQCCYIGVRDGLKGSLTPSEHISFWRAMAGERRSRGLEDDSSALERFDLSDFASSPTAWLSTGQRRRLALTRLLCAARPVWLLDEPLNGLDTWAAEELKRLAARHLEDGGIIVAASHQPLDWPAMTVLAVGEPNEARLSRREPLA
ncbi:MAG: heme ABC exporter, ATP-binding protein CcmA [Rhizobiales bacterium 65-9]|nr:heme ABC exporter ATP-binding protein CcmA [Hyphomicrobiales bacterium]OJY36518.1 MAG: heme ABC exporter, ATP-binding protein CcmA [Rhizobiales bacterium 65-9]